MLTALQRRDPEYSAHGRWSADDMMCWSACGASQGARSCTPR